MNNRKKYRIVTADMGYGHQRAIDPFADIAYQRIININTDPFTPVAEQKYWRQILKTYEFLSRARKMPVIGAALYMMLNYMLRIPDEGISANQSRPGFQVKLLKFQIRRGLCRGVIHKIKSEDMILLTSFYAPAVAADYAGIRNIYCIICDSDLNRVWVSDQPAESNITYFAPCSKAADRLRLCGVKPEHIILTGFPLHPELLGNRDFVLAKENFCKRLQRLNYAGVYDFLDLDGCKKTLSGETPVPVTLTYAVGGAGAQTEIAPRLLEELHEEIMAGRIKMKLIAGTRKEVRAFFENLPLVKQSGGVEIIFEDEKNTYFKSFNTAMAETDLLITKPSEVSFYAGLGIPIIMTPAIGSQEEHNREWLLGMGAAIDLPEKSKLDQWFQYKIRSGYFAGLALNGFKNIEKDGYFKILDYLENTTGAK